VSAELYEVLSLAARYLFAFLGVVIVLRSYLWLIADRAEKHRRLRRLPDAGNIGELVVCAGGEELPEGSCLPVPWEGVLGSVRSCDVVVPCEGVRKRHLRFSYEIGAGLRIYPESGCEAMVDSTALDCRSGDRAAPMVHGSFLRVGSALLRLRVFAGLDSAAGFGDDAAFGSGAAPVNGAPFAEDALSGNPAAFESGPAFGDGVPESAGMEATQAEAAPVPPPISGTRKRRSARWEEDWSE